MDISLNPHHQRVLAYFDYSHLPNSLGAASRPFHNLAEDIARQASEQGGYVDQAEITVALRRLLEAKDAAVRAFLRAPMTPKRLEKPEEPIAGQTQLH